MRKLVMCKRRVKTESGQRLTLIYSVTVEILSDEELGVELESYGVCIGVKESGQEKYVRNITLKSSEIFKLTELLASNYVTPVTLSDVICDWLARY